MRVGVRRRPGSESNRKPLFVPGSSEFRMAEVQKAENGRQTGLGHYRESDERRYRQGDPES